MNDDAEARDAEMIDRLYEGGEDPDGLGLVRSLVARVREEHAGAEPPQAVSARLLQAAEEHAPKKKAVAVAAEAPGLMERLRRWWMPVSGAVMVAGALALYLNQGGKAAERKQHVESAAPEKRAELKEDEAPAAVTTPDPTPTMPAAPTLTEPEAPREEVAKPEAVAEYRGRGKGGGGARKDIGGSGEGLAAGSGSAAGADRYAGDFTDDGDADKKPVVSTNATVKIATDSGAVAEKKKLEAPPQQVAVPPPPPPAPRPSDVDDSPNVTTGAGSVAKQEESKEQQRALTVQDYLVVARAAAKKGDCKRVAQLGAKVKSMDATYYKKTFATDAAIKGCSK